MTKRITAFLGLALLILPWIASALSTSAFFVIASNVRSGTTSNNAAGELLPALLNGYIFAGLVAMSGIIVLGVCVDGMEYRPTWLFWMLLLLGVVWLPFYAAGTMLGVALILYTGLNYRKFYPASNHAT